MPAEEALEGAEEGLRHPAEIPDHLVAVFHVFGNNIREDMIGEGVRNAEAVILQPLTAAGAGIAISDRAARLGLGIIRDQPVELPELALAVSGYNPKDFPGPAVVDHDLQHGVRAGVLAELLQHFFRMRGVMDDAEGI